MKTFNAQKRREIKRECRSRVSARLGTCIGANFLYGLPIVLVLLIVYITMFGSSFSLMLAGADETAVAQAMMRGTGSGIFTALLLTIVISGPLSFGLMRFYTDLSRGAQPGAGMVLQPFTSGSSLWTGIRMSFCLFLRSLIWNALPTFLLTNAGIVLVFLGIRSGSTNFLNVSIVILYVIYAIVSFFIGIKVLTYSLGWVVLHDNEQYGAWSASRDASAVFRGHFGALVVFVLSFLGWDILASGAVYLCILLGTLGAGILGGGLGLAVMVVCLVAALCLGLVLGTFVSAYSQTSLIAMFDYLATPEPQFASFEQADCDWTPTGASAPTDTETQAHTDESSDEPHDAQ